MDSMAFLQGSLADLVKLVSKSECKFPILSQMKHINSNEKKEMLIRKGVYPYEFATSLEKLKNTKNIPKYEEFYSSLTSSNVSKDYYNYAKDVFRKFGCQNMMQYTLLYLESDTYLLADVFLEFRKKLMSKFGLDPCWYLSLPSYSYDSMLYTTKVKLDVIKDMDQYLFISGNIRGGHSFIGQRYEKSKNNIGRYIRSILYYDANNLYGWAQSQFLPTGEYKFLKPYEINYQEILNTKDDAKYGYIVECTLEYPENLHKKHREFPLAPHQHVIAPDDLSVYQDNCHDILGTKPKKEKKMTATFLKREKYVTHYQNLKLYVKLGMKVTRIHRVLKFHQSNFLKKYIDFCTEMRKQSDSDFEKSLFKLMANSCYGKTIENPRKHVNVKFSTCEEETMKLMSKPSFKSALIISDNLVAIFLRKESVKIKQPIAVGFTILELSKLFMYKAFYEEIQPAFPDLKVLFSDTDSLCISVPYEKNPHQKIGHILDTSNFEKSHAMFTEEHISQLGYF